MKVSRYNIHVELSSRQTAVFNALTRAIAVVDTHLAQHPCSIATIDQSTDLGRILIDGGFIYPNDTNEYSLFRHWISRARYRNITYMPTVLTTYNCNMNCVYCIGQPHVDAPPMTLGTARSVADFIVDVAVQRRYPIIKLGFYGGEPLLNMPVIEAVCERVNSYATEAGVLFGHHVITNGLLLTEDTSRLLAKLGVISFQVSLDGCREVHDARRPSICGGSTFDTIIGNLISAIPHFRMAVVTSVVDSHNLPHLPGLFAELKAMGLTAPELHETVRYEFGLLSHNRMGSGHCLKHYQMNAEAADTCLSVYKAAQRVGLNARIPVLFDGICPRQRDGSMVIGPEGTLYGCISGAGAEEFAIGNCITDSPTLLNVRNSQFSEANLWQHGRGACQECAFLPLCNGGCLHDAFVGNGRLESLACPREYYERYIPKAVALLVDDSLCSGAGEIAVKRPPVLIA